MLTEIQVNIIKNQVKNFLESREFLAKDLRVYQHKLKKNFVFVLAWNENLGSKAVNVSDGDIRFLEGTITDFNQYYIF